VTRIVVVLLTFTLAACAGPPDAGHTTLIYASPYGPNHPFSLADQAWIRRVETLAHGTLRIRPVWSGALLSSDQSLEELRHGVADIGLITPIYVRGGVHLIRTQSGFYAGARTSAQQVALYQCLAAAVPEYARELSGLKVLAIQGGTLPGVVTRLRPVRTLEDLRGLRLRAPTELLGVLRDLGADPVNMPMGEVYSALAKGVLDGVIAPADALHSMHLSEVARYYTRLEIPRGAYPARAMSVRRWRTLSAAQQQILSDAEPFWEEALAAATQAAVAKGEAQGRRDGLAFLPIAPGDQQRFDALYARDASLSAARLQTLGIDGPAVYARARRLATQLPGNGTLNCGLATSAPVPEPARAP